ncbi:MAG: rhodanese-related sulfurtransferase [Acholeplasmataceae bacterium]|nr:rhodanese-related sulfurtransferase [Acholeplasmataceae bacterium]MDD4204225.1 rhodanese-related sulfurtransferase [Acholeplasmataceae bacterium]MDD4469087.1 rhodanese-related sulfurtransferase [Acholeplasmataceae bacterium]MDD4824432.1 rhodanese-related sulfurtransferase [Acholeplasmataceae bacterium]
MNEYLVILYYHYTKLNELETFRDIHQEFCDRHNLLGRIYVASEGINGTLSGLKDDVLAYMEYLKNDQRFEEIVFKVDEADKHAFKKMHVRVKNELVNLSLETDINPKKLTGEYVEPRDFYLRMQDPHTIVLDARNDYEHQIGHFRGAIRPNIRNFRELPDWIKENESLLKDKKILTYCTGGIRCEKLSGWLKAEGYNDVGQLKGGIITYGKDEVAQGQLWDGQCYVFDERLKVNINKVESVVVGRDHFDGTPCERQINCANPECNKQILVSQENEDKYLGGCSIECSRHPRNRYVALHKLTSKEIEKRIKY